MISIHALREEGDCQRLLRHPHRQQFLSTLSARRATERGPDQMPARTISIHALREEGDKSALLKWKPLCRFLSTLSARRATPRSGRRAE